MILTACPPLFDPIHEDDCSATLAPVRIRDTCHCASARPTNEMFSLRLPPMVLQYLSPNMSTSSSCAPCRLLQPHKAPKDSNIIRVHKAFIAVNLEGAIPNCIGTL